MEPIHELPRNHPLTDVPPRFSVEVSSVPGLSFLRPSVVKPIAIVREAHGLGSNIWGDRTLSSSVR